MTGRARFLELAASMRGRRVVVYGDIVADRFIYGAPKRISREAPVLILRQYREDVLLGGAGNATNNVRSLGGAPLPVALLGNDAVGDRLLEELASTGIDVRGVLRAERYRTPTKTRVLGGMQHAARQQIVRYDLEESIELDAAERSRIADVAAELVAGCDAILVSDYGYGIVDAHLVRDLAAAARGRPVTLDSRYALVEFRGVTAATPNEDEAATMTGVGLGYDDDERILLRTAAESICSRIEAKAVLITRGSRGMALFEMGRDELELIPVYGTDQVADVTGAGDTVIAAFTLALASGADFSEAARLANYAASIVVMKMGTATATNEELCHAIERDERL